jgi:hypothetical protein
MPEDSSTPVPPPSFEPTVEELIGQLEQLYAEATSRFSRLDDFLQFESNFAIRDGHICIPQTTWDRWMQELADIETVEQPPYLARVEKILETDDGYMQREVARVAARLVDSIAKYPGEGARWDALRRFQGQMRYLLEKYEKT